MNTQEQLIALVKKIGKNQGAEIQASTHIKSFGFDSLDLLEFQMEVDELFGIEVQIEDFLKCQTLADIAALVDACRQ
jgi:acyl carrier protein